MRTFKLFAAKNFKIFRIVCYIRKNKEEGLVEVVRTRGAGSIFRVCVPKLKGRVHYFSMQIIMNKCFLLNPEKKKLTQTRLVVFEKNAPLILKNDVTEPKARLLLTDLRTVLDFRKSLKLSFNLLTA